MFDHEAHSMWKRHLRHDFACQMCVKYFMNYYDIENYLQKKIKNVFLLKNVCKI